MAARQRLGVKRRLVEAARNSDFVDRLGVEELLVLLPRRGADAALVAAERLRAAVAGEPVAGLSITVSAGVAGAGGRDLDLARLTADADDALYRAERARRDRVRAAEPAAHAA